MARDADGGITIDREVGRDVVTGDAMSVRASDWLVIPAFNEAEVIAATLRDVLTTFPNVVVVDDCSRDNTAEIALRNGAHVCRHPVNLGQGAALQTGVDYALARDAQRIVTFDADGQHRPADAMHMLDVLDRTKCDVVLASRFLGHAEGIPKRRRRLLRVATWYTRWSTGLAVTDTHNGLRALNRHAAQSIRIKQNRMAHASELLELISRNQLRYVEVPCTILYTRYSMAKGQKISGAFAIMIDLYVRKLHQ